jgi:hypothetical protein
MLTMWFGCAIVLAIIKSWSCSYMNIEKIIYNKSLMNKYRQALSWYDWLLDCFEIKKKLKE